MATFAVVAAACARPPEPEPDAVDEAADTATVSDVIRAGRPPQPEWPVVDSARADVTGDGSPDRVELSADVEVDGAGRLVWDHGHRWRLVVHTADGSYVLLRDEFVPSGMLSIRVEDDQADGPHARPSIVVDERGRFRTRLVRFRYSEGGFVAESVVVDSD